MLATSLHSRSAARGASCSVSYSALELVQLTIYRRFRRDMDMKQPTRITATRAIHSPDEDGRWTARMLALSMGLLFSLVLVLQAYTW
jgi:hypothetical protein